MRSYAILVLLGACHTPRAQTPTVAAGPPAHVGCAAAPDEAGGCAYESTGLPALTTDGTLVLYAELKEFGGPIAGHFRVVERRVEDDQEAGELMVEQETTGRLPAAERDESLTRANAALARLPSAPLTAYPRDCDQGGGLGCDITDEPIVITANVGPLVVIFDEPRLRVSRDGRALLDQDMPAWSAPIQGQGEGDTCRNPAYLDGVWADVGRGVLLLKIGYSGFGACWAPPSTYHVVKLPR